MIQKLTAKDCHKKNVFKNLMIWLKTVHGHATFVPRRAVGELQILMIRERSHLIGPAPGYRAL